MNKKHKFDNVYDGPYRVTFASESYVEVMRKGKKVKFHKNLIKKAQTDYENEPPLVVPKFTFDQDI